MKKTDAIQHFGNEAKLAQALGLSRSAVNQWGENVPPLRAYQIRELIEQRDLPPPAPEQLAA